jgi:hypothetical protein
LPEVVAGEVKHFGENIGIPCISTMDILLEEMNEYEIHIKACIQSKNLQSTNIDRRKGKYKSPVTLIPRTHHPPFFFLLYDL